MDLTDTPAIEMSSRDHLAALQIERLKRTVAAVLDAGTPLSSRLRGSGVSSAAEVTSHDDLSKLPFSMKADLRDHYPFGLFAKPLNEIARFHASSGTRGKPTVVGYTAKDLKVWAEVVARCLRLAGVRPGMVVHNAYGYGLFTGGLGLHQGAELLGCPVVPISGGLTQRQVMLLQDLGGQVLCATPSYALNIAECISNTGIDPQSLALEIGIFGAEPWTDEMRNAIEAQLGLKALNLYGLSEIVGPGVSAECIEGQNGLHIHEDHFLPEIVDPDTGKQVPPGAEGELVFTTLSKEALPLLRYRTGDISSLDYSPCVCGRTLVRMSRVRGRYDDMLIIRGANLYPSEIERILLSTGDVSPHYQLTVERPAAMDELTVLCESAIRDMSKDDRESLSRKLERTLQGETGLTMTVMVLPPDSVARSEGKAIRVVDKRPR